MVSFFSQASLAGIAIPPEMDKELSALGVRLPQGQVDQVSAAVQSVAVARVGSSGAQGAQVLDRMFRLGRRCLA